MIGDIIGVEGIVKMFSKIGTPHIPVWEKP